MRLSLCLLFCLYAVCPCACTRPPESALYDPAQAPVDADELAQLLGVNHWKISKLPASNRPYWGVRIVAFKPDHAVINESTTEQFGTSITAGGNSQILVGLKDEPDGVAGTLMLGTRPNAVSLTRFKFADVSTDKSEETALGLIWRDDRAELESFVDQNRQKTFTISIELLHERPR